MNTKEEQFQLVQLIKQRILASSQQWLAFDDFMHLALYTPDFGYYTNGLQKFGLTAQTGSDFVTAPELSTAFAYALANQIHEALDHTRTHCVYEFGAGTGRLAEQLLARFEAMGTSLQHYYIVDISTQLRAQQTNTLRPYLDKVQWISHLDNTHHSSIHGVVIGNEVLDAIPAKLLYRNNAVWYERGVTLNAQGEFTFQDVLTSLRPPIEIDGAHNYLTEINPQQGAFIQTIAQGLFQGNGVAFFIDYGFGERQYYHTQRHMGTLMCHHLHTADSNPLVNVGMKDITAHVDFTAVAVNAQQVGLHAIGYTNQANFLINCGLIDWLNAEKSPQKRANATKLMHEHEMGELFKVIALGKDSTYIPMGFTRSDQTFRL